MQDILHKITRLGAEGADFSCRNRRAIPTSKRCRIKRCSFLPSTREKQSATPSPHCLSQASSQAATFIGHQRSETTHTLGQGSAPCWPRMETGCSFIVRGSTVSVRCRRRDRVSLQPHGRHNGHRRRPHPRTREGSEIALLLTPISYSLTPYFGITPD